MTAKLNDYQMTMNDHQMTILAGEVFFSLLSMVNKFYKGKNYLTYFSYIANLIMIKNTYYGL